MAARKKAEDLDDLLTALVPSERLDVFALRAGIAPASLFNLRRGKVARPHRSTIATLATALHVAPERVRAAIEESVRRAHG